MDKNKISKHLAEHISAPKRFEQDYFHLAICEVVAGNYSAAQKWFVDSIPLMLGTNPYWRASGLVDWLVNVTVLSGAHENFPSVIEELTIYRISATKIHPGGRSPLAHYCYAMMELLFPGQGDLQAWINDLLKRPKCKDMVACGHAIDALARRDNQAFSQSLQELLLVHERMAKYGQLRLTPEGWLCLSAMCLATVGRLMGMKVSVQSDYYSEGYIDYLLDHITPVGYGPVDG